MVGPHNHLDWLDTQGDRARDLVTRWASINTHSHHTAGLDAMAMALREAFGPLQTAVNRLDLPPQPDVDGHGRPTNRPLGPALSLRKRPSAPRRVFLGIHMDTVYPPDDSFQQVTEPDAHTLRGPGVADAKGGLAVMLLALESFERSKWAEHLGWEVFINPDEEIGSPGSRPLLEQAAQRNHVGLVYEPSLPDGTMISQRKGSGNFTLVVHGRAAHAGREFHVGRSAVHAVARLIAQLDAVNGRREGVTVNVGRVEGGGAVNVVADLAVCRLNVRVNNADEQAFVEAELRRLVEQADAQEGIAVTCHGQFQRPPKPVDDATRRLMDYIADCGQQLGTPIQWQPSGGVCDGNILAAAGLPTIDTLGPVGGGIHSDREYLRLDSVIERAKLSALLLTRLAAGELDWPGTPAQQRDDAPSPHATR
jgi:glutamate carboxypeptidase